MDEIWHASTKDWHSQKACSYCFDTQSVNQCENKKNNLKIW